jgi:hypothetical protein
MVSEIKSIERAQQLLHCILKNFNFYIFHPILKLMHFFLQNHLSLWVTIIDHQIFFFYFILNKIWPKFTNFAYLEGIYNFFLLSISMHFFFFELILLSTFGCMLTYFFYIFWFRR